MKKLYILTIAALAMTTANAQIVFDSDVSAWTSGAPDDFMGSKSNIAGADVIEITTGNSYGTSAAQLVNATTSHKRFTTQPVSVTDLQGYELKVYARGNGDMRFGLYDGNSGASAGYTAYTSYQTVSGSTSSVYTAQLAATNTLATGEFVISVRNTVAPDHIIIDSVVISEVTIAPPSTVSVYDIQYTTAVPANSPYVGQTVNTGGIVTHVRSDNKGWYISSGTGPYSGVYVYSTLNPAPVAVGDSVTFSAEVVEFNELTELSFPTNITVVSSSNFFLATSVPTGSAMTEAYEGCFVSTCGLCTAADNTFGDWIINDGTGDAEIGDFFFTNTGTQGTTYNVKGIIDFAFGFFGFLPRNGSDVQSTVSCVVGVEENVTTYNLYPNPVASELNIEVEGKHNVSILDMNGRVLSTMVINGFTTINTTELSSGVYFINVDNNVTKFIKK
jgi:hypothetical protein